MKDSEKIDKDEKKQRQKFKQMLLQTLQDDEEVRQAIRALMLLPQEAPTANELIKQLQQCQKELQHERKITQSLRVKNKQLQDKLSLYQRQNEVFQEELKERFPNGWTFYRAYANLDDYLRRLLQSVVHRDGFSAFIVGLSQENSPGVVWDACRDAVLRDANLTSCQFLQQLFLYSLQLVNLNGTSDAFSLEHTEVGETYDFRLHELAPDSHVQGKIREVLLPGFRNQYRDKLLRKSLVRI